VRPSTVCVTARTVEVLSRQVQWGSTPVDGLVVKWPRVPAETMGMPVDVADVDRQTVETPAFDASAAPSDDRAVLAAALVELFAESDTQPTPQDMVERSGLPLPTVLHLLEDLETLAVGIFRTQIERVWSQLEPLPGRDAPLPARLHALVEQRTRLFEQVAPTRRVASQIMTGSPALQRGLARSEAFLRRQVTEVFEVELATVNDPDRIAAIDFATSWEAWEALRRDSRHSVGAASRIMCVTLETLLTAP